MAKAIVCDCDLPTRGAKLILRGGFGHSDKQIFVSGNSRGGEYFSRGQCPPGLGRAK